MNWFIAKLVFDIVSGDGKHRPQFDEQYRLIRADNHEEAFEKACTLGRKEEEIFLNNKSNLVRWSFVNISELFMVDDLRDGMELFSGTYEAADRHLYRETINLRAAFIQSRFLRVAGEA